MSVVSLGTPVQDTFIDIYNNNKSLRRVSSTLIIIIVGEVMDLDNDVRKDLLYRLMKWFTFIIQKYLDGTKKDLYYGLDEIRIIRSLCSRRHNNDQKERILSDIFISILPFSINKHPGIKQMFFEIQEVNVKYYSHCEKKFLKEKTLNLTAMLITEIRWDEEENIIIPTWYPLLLDKAEGGRYGNMRRRMEELVQMYTNK